MRQFPTILSYELKNYFKNKVFVGSTLFIVAVLAVVMFLPNLMDFFGSMGSGQEDSTQQSVILVSAPSQELGEGIVQAFTTAFPDRSVTLTQDAIDQIKAQVSDGRADCAFVFDSLTSYTYYVLNRSLYDQTTQTANQVLVGLAQVEAMAQQGLTIDQASQILSLQIDAKEELLGVDQVQNYWYTYIMIMALYMVIMLYGQMVASHVATEKSSRAMELLITSASPVSMMFGKVLASCLAGFVQLAVIFGSALLFYQLNQDSWGGNNVMTSLFDMPPSLLVYMLVFFVLGFLLYAFLYGAIGSTATKLEDINTSVMPLTLLFIVAFCVVMFGLASGTVDNLAMLVCSFIPFTSPIAMFTRIAMSSVPPYQIALSIGLLAVSVVGIGVLSAKIYRVGVLLYGTPPKLGAILKTVWRA
ncbi:MAG TPA: ABC transporter permease [Candidatus Enterenecus avicola]|nr:ABC transporter permease [Candidatus Enterenecus avicola]